MWTYVFTHVTLAGTAESLNGKDLAFLHLSLVAALNNGHALSAVDNVLVNVVTVEVANTLDGVHGAVQLDLVALHGLLDSSTDVAHADVNTSFL